jgi:hypothetical protein
MRPFAEICEWRWRLRSFGLFQRCCLFILQKYAFRLNGCSGPPNTRIRFWPSPPPQTEILNTSKGTVGARPELTPRYILSSTQLILLLPRPRAINRANSMASPPWFPGFAACKAVGALSCFTQRKIGVDAALKPTKLALRECLHRFGTAPFDAQVRALIVWILMSGRQDARIPPSGRRE